MPCESGGGSNTVYIHADDCECKKCRNWEQYVARQKHMKKADTPILIAKVKELAGASRGVLVSIEKGRIEIDENEWNEKTLAQSFSDWLKECDPFPESMKFEYKTVFGRHFLFTWHEHGPVVVRP